MRFWILILPIALIAACRPTMPEAVELAYESLNRTIDFNSDVRPILSDKCFLCHGPDDNKREAGLRLDIRKAAISPLQQSEGAVAIVPGKADRSELVRRILSDDLEQRMPTAESKLELTPKEKAILIKWIEEGAEYKPHWAFLPPNATDIPDVKDKSWGHNAIDHFIDQKLSINNLKPSSTASRDLLLRRLSFDLTGLPPTPEELEAFEQDQTENAYEKQVDRLLASPHYGERMAIDWMDLARFADTHGYQADRYRNMSPWRDWVIKAFNQNLPYDQFITWQLAGDLLPNATRDQIIATGFNRLHPQNLEDGIIDEEFRVAYVSDRVDVMTQGLLAMTAACAKCHDHKFDPISQKNYYELYSFFNNINETGLISWEGATPVPTLLLPTETQTNALATLQSKVQEKRQQLTNLEHDQINQVKNWIDRGTYRQIDASRNPEGMLAHFPLNQSLRNRTNSSESAVMDRRFSAVEKPDYVTVQNRSGILLDGDSWLDLQKIGIFGREKTFSIALDMHIPSELKEGYIFHKGMGTRLHAYRGFHLAIDNQQLQVVMAHTWPDNAIIIDYPTDIPRDRWIHLTMSYDGSSEAAGISLYLNGQELTAKVVQDNLYKDILFHNLEDVIYPKPIEPGLQFGGRWRGKGLKGAVIDDIKVFDRRLSNLEVIQTADQNHFREIISKGPTQLNEKERRLLTQYFQATRDRSYQLGLSELQKLRKILVDSMENVQEVMVMREMENKRKSYVLERGVYNEYGEEVSPGVPEFILPFPDDAPRDRLGLAKWVTDKNNPLTARVAVNRYWQLFFGRGLVRTVEDFGSQGELPSHPQLLDWLAIELMESGWNIKQLVKLMVMSATYRQDSNGSAIGLASDPQNIWLSRGPSNRLTSEMIRDNALHASGLLHNKIGGESVRPYQPDDLYSLNMDPYQLDKGKKMYRRSLYTYWRRTIPHPTLATFDSPERNECTVRRQKTNTPLQALVLLNDPAYVEACKAIGETIAGSNKLRNGIQNAFIKLTGRSASDEELSTLIKAQEEELQSFKQHPQKARGWLSTGQYDLQGTADPDVVAANAVVASIIMNADASIMKR